MEVPLGTSILTSSENKMVKVLIMGLPGSGKTFLAKKLASKLGALWLNADRVRATMNKDLGFCLHDRIVHSSRMGWMAQFAKESGIISIADFVCPTPATREAFNADYTIFMNTISAGRFEDTNALFIPPNFPDFVINSFACYELELLEVLCSKILNLKFTKSDNHCIIN